MSNGRLATPERAASLFASGIKTAQISLEAPEASMHDMLCGVQGCFDDTVAGIKALIAAGISVQTNSTLTAANHDALLELPDFVAGLGIRRMSMNLFIPAGTGIKSSDLFYPYKKAGSFIDAAKKRAEKAGLTFFWYSPIPICLYNPLANGLGNKSCAACDGLLSVAPNGDVLPCSSWPEPVGNMLSDGFSKLWFSDKAQWLKHKNYAPPECRECEFFGACQAACPLYWKQIGYAEIKDAWAALKK